MAGGKDGPIFSKETNITIIGARSYYILIPAQVRRILRITKKSRVRLTLKTDKTILIEKTIKRA